MEHRTARHPPTARDKQQPSWYHNSTPKQHPLSGTASYLVGGVQDDRAGCRVHGDRRNGQLALTAQSSAGETTKKRGRRRRRRRGKPKVPVGLPQQLPYREDKGTADWFSSTVVLALVICHSRTPIAVALHNDRPVNTLSLSISHLISPEVDQSDQIVDRVHFKQPDLAHRQRCGSIGRCQCWAQSGHAGRTFRGLAGWIARWALRWHSGGCLRGLQGRLQGR